MVRVKINDKYSRLLVLEHLWTDSHYRKYWKCVCDCGKEHTVHSGNLTSGNTRSCGCLSREVKKAKRISNNHSEITAIILNYKRHAKNRNLGWSLNRIEVEELIKKNCYYCDEPPSNIKQTKNTINPLKYNGIDRVNNTKGYIKNNVVTCCKQCNLAKRDLSLTDFIYWIKRVHINMAEQWS